LIFIRTPPFFFFIKQEGSTLQTGTEEFSATDEDCTIPQGWFPVLGGRPVSVARLSGLASKWRSPRDVMFHRTRDAIANDSPLCEPQRSAMNAPLYARSRRSRSVDATIRGISDR
jgi:hypothetical protein